MPTRYPGRLLSATRPTVTRSSTSAGMFTGTEITQYAQAGLWLSRPNAPTITSAIPGDQRGIVSFTAPADNGGSSITSYIVTSNPGNITASGSSSPITITGLTNNTPYTFTVSAVNILGRGPESAASSSVTPQAFGSTLLAEVYNTGTSSAITGSFTIPSDLTTSIYVFAAAGGGSGGCVFQQDNGSGAGGGGAANITGYKIAVSPGQVISYSVGNGGAARTSANNGVTGGSTTLTRSGSTIFNLSGGGGGESGRSAGANGGAGGADNGYGVSGGGGGFGGNRTPNTRDAGSGGSVTNGCGGGGGGGGHLAGRTGGTGGTSTVTASSRSFVKGDGTFITVSFAGTTGGASGGFGTTGAAPESRPLAYGGNGTAQDGNTGGGGGAGGGIKPTVNGVTQADFYGGGGGGYKSYISNANTGPQGHGAGGFLIVVSMND